MLIPTLTIIGRASAEEAGTPTDTSQEMQIAPEYAVKFSYTADWSRQTQELLKITIVDKYQSGYAKVEIRIDGDAWRLALSKYLHEILCITEGIVHAKLSESPHLQSVGLFLAQHLEAILLFFRC